MYMEFFWDSKLSQARKDEIRLWVNSLNEREQDMLEDIRRDVRQDTEFDCSD